MAPTRKYAISEDVLDTLFSKLGRVVDNWDESKEPPNPLLRNLNQNTEKLEELQGATGTTPLQRYLLDKVHQERKALYEKWQKKQRQTDDITDKTPSSPETLQQPPQQPPASSMVPVKTSKRTSKGRPTKKAASYHCAKCARSFTSQKRLDNHVDIMHRPGGGKRPRIIDKDETNVFKPNIRLTGPVTGWFGTREAAQKLTGATPYTEPRPKPRGKPWHRDPDEVPAGDYN